MNFLERRYSYGDCWGYSPIKFTLMTQAEAAPKRSTRTCCLYTSYFKSSCFMLYCVRRLHCWNIPYGSVRYHTSGFSTAAVLPYILYLQCIVHYLIGMLSTLYIETSFTTVCHKSPPPHQLPSAGTQTVSCQYLLKIWSYICDKYCSFCFGLSFL